MILTNYDLETLQVSRHEACHAAYAAAVGFPVDKVQIAPQGFTDFRLPLRAWELYRAWERAPFATERQLVAIVGVVQAPARISRELMHATCGDAAMLQQWREEWQRVCALHPQGHASHSLPLPPLPWPDVCERSQAAIAAWITAPGARLALRMLAVALAREGAVDAVGWQLLWGLAACKPLRRTTPRGG